jgi:hypothetical protein
LSLDIFKWVAENYPDYVDSFDKAKEALVWQRNSMNLNAIA